jgi:biopolymer transport protein ExbD
VKQVVLGIDPADCAVLQPSATDGLPVDCHVRLNDDLIPMTDLAAQIGEIFSAREPSDRVLFLAADDQLNYEGVMRIVDVAKSGVDGLRIGLITPQ